MENNKTQNMCPVWDTQATTRDKPERKGVAVDSPRAGGKYFISEEAIRKAGQPDDKEKARLTSWLVNRRSLGNECPEIEGKRIDDKDYGPAPTMSQRADGLLRLIRFKTLKIGNPLDVLSYVPKEHESFYRDPVYQEMMAWSESTDINGVMFEFCV